MSFAEWGLFGMVLLIYSGGLDRLIEASRFFWGLTRTIHIPRPNPDCTICHGDGHFRHHGTCILECYNGCAERKPQKVVSQTLRMAMEKLGRRMDLNESDAKKLARDFEDLANSYLGPPVPRFVRIDTRTQKAA